jgi:hypothetical protein
LSRVWGRTKGVSTEKRSLAYEARNDPEMSGLVNYALCGNKGKTLKTTKKTDDRQGDYGEGSSSRRLVHLPDADKGKVEAVEACEESDYRYPVQKATAEV